MTSTTSARMTTNRRVGTFLVVGLAALATIVSAQAPTVQLIEAKRHLLAKTSGRIDRVAVLPGGLIAVLDADFANETAQSVEIYDPQGKRVRKIGAFGRGPGQYFRPRDLDVSSQGDLWVVDIDSRLTRFSVQGQVKETRLVQNPGFPVHGLAFDESRGLYYLAGCPPEKLAAPGGCEALHSYDAKTGKRKASFLPITLATRPFSHFGFETWSIGVDRKGRVFGVEGPLLKLFRVDPARATGEALAFRSKAFLPPPVADPAAVTVEWQERVFATSSHLTNLVVVDPYVAVSIRQPQGKGYLLALFDTEGTQLGVDLPVPGALVGSSPTGNLYFARNAAKGFELVEQKIVRSGSK
jgi:6-bladed beta-propeller